LYRPYSGLAQSSEENFDSAFSIPLFYLGPFCLIYCPGCVGMRMRVHVVALTVVIAANPEMLSGISCSVPERHIESNLNKAFNFLFYYLLADLPFQNWRHGICFLAGRTK